MFKIILFTMMMIGSTFASATEINDFINKHNCDQVLDKGYYQVCYDYNLKAARYVGYTLDGSKVNAVNIKKRPRFYADKHIPAKYRVTYSDYTHSGYDRGHNLSDASADWSLKSQKATYAMSQIIAQAPSVNRRTWIKVEKYERKVAFKLGMVHVINGVIYPSNPKRIGRAKMAVPSAFWKMIYDNNGFERCFYYENNLKAKVKGDKLRDHLVDCSGLL